MRNLLLIHLALLMWCCEGLASARPQNPATPEISVEEYCRLTVSLMEISELRWQQRVSVATQSRNKTDRKRLGAELESATGGIREKEQHLYRQSGLSRFEYLRYANQHKAEIMNYLEENPEVANAIDEIKKRIDHVVQEFESTVQHSRKGVQR